MPQHIVRLSLTTEQKQELERLKAVRSSRICHYPNRAVREHSRLEIIETVALAERNLLYREVTDLLGVTRKNAGRYRTQISQLG